MTAGPAPADYLIRRLPGSAAHAVAEMCHPVSLIDRRHGQLRRRRRAVAEQPDPAAQEDRDQVQPDLVDDAGGQASWAVWVTTNTGMWKVGFSPQGPMPRFAIRRPITIAPAGANTASSNARDSASPRPAPGWRDPGRARATRDSGGR